jgi:serine/threonine protein phosphatase PrpC
MGKIQPEDIPRHPMRAIVNSCLGGKNGQGDFSVDPKWQEENPPIIHLKSNDLILLCSDGLNNALLSPSLENLVKEGYANPELLNQNLLDNALEGRMFWFGSFYFLSFTLSISTFTTLIF